MKSSVCYEAMYTLAEYQCGLSWQCPSFAVVTLTDLLKATIHTIFLSYIMNVDAELQHYHLY